MNTTTTVALILLLAAAPARGQPRRENTWPRDPALLLEHLNSWYKDEIDVVERPQAHKGRAASGETRGWIGLHKELLQALGYAVRWDPAKKRYGMQGRAAEDWVEKNPAAYLGRYETDVFVDDDAQNRAAGRGGSGMKVRASMEIGRRGGRFTVRYGVAPADGSKPATTAWLSGVRLRSNQIASDPVVIKAAWPHHLPEHFEGRFVKPGALIFGGRLYRRVSK